VLAAFAHDIRTPLTGILGLADLLATSGLGERERRWIHALKDTAEHLAELTTLMVEGARAGAGHLQPRREVFDLTRLIEALVASLKVRAEAKNLACETAIAAELPDQVIGDPVLLRSVLENLLANAVKFTGHGKITFAVSGTALRSKPRLSFAVADSGIGMTAAEIRRVFRPFAQANRYVSSKFGGAGLGLAQVRRLARAMGGDVTAASAPGQGSTFRLTVTLARATPSPAALADYGSGTPAPALHVLCVEDNPHGRVVMNAMLAELGHRVDFAGSGEAAVAAVTHGGYDAVLMDITRDGIDGFEALRCIRKLPGAAAGVPVIGISGSPDSPAAVSASAMNACLAKPISPRALAEALARVTASRP
jgi:CheY-like chemotaxis protein